MIRELWYNNTIMKCEICHKNEAQTAISTIVNGVEDELYVCTECAKNEKLRRQKKSQRTRKGSLLPPGLSMSVTQIGGSEPPPPQLIEALMNAVQSAFPGIRPADDLEGEDSAPEIEAFEPPANSAAPKAVAPEPKEEVNLKGIEKPFILAGGMQLEGLFLIGEIDAVKRSAHALGMELFGYSIDGIFDSGHIYRLKYCGDFERALRFRDEIVRQERNARVRLFEDMARYFEDALCRALSILKNARLLSSGELLDLLSPLRLAALESMLDGITLRRIEAMVAAIDIYSGEETLDVRQRDKIDAERADDMNKRFEDVVLNERAEDRFQ